MGGYGSGKWTRAGTKRTTAAAVPLDIRQVYRVNRKGFNWPGFCTWYWKTGDSVRLLVGDTGAHVTYRHMGVEVAERFAIQWTPCNFGGRRPWWICTCGARVAVLYRADRYFRCRRCHELAYESQRENDWRRTLARAHAIRRRLGSRGALFDPVPERPKGMHGDTYHELAMALLNLQLGAADAMKADFARMDDRLRRLKWNGPPPVP